MSRVPTPLPQPPTVKEQLDMIVERLKGPVEQRGGTVRALNNIRHLWEELVNLAKEPRLFVIWAGETPRGDQWLNRVERDWQVILVQGHGFNNLAQDKVGEQEPFSESVESVRDLIRTMTGLTEEFPVEYRGAKPLPSVIPGGEDVNVFGDAFVLEFRSVNDIPRINTESPIQPEE